MGQKVHLVDRLPQGMPPRLPVQVNQLPAFDLSSVKEVAAPAYWSHPRAVFLRTASAPPRYHYVPGSHAQQPGAPESSSRYLFFQCSKQPGAHEAQDCPETTEQPSARQPRHALLALPANITPQGG